MLSCRCLCGAQRALSDLVYSEPVVLVGAGPAAYQDLEFARTVAGPVIAVDGGYDAVTAWDVTPDAVLGDMDSIRADVPESIPTFRIVEQDSTDLEKALRLVDAPLCIGVGFLDGRLDHTLAAMHALIASSAANVILIGSEDVVFAAPSEWRATLPIGARVSFFPVRRVPAVSSKGLRWPVDGLLMEGGGQIGVSNETLSAEIAVRFAERGIVTILPRAHLAQVVLSLS